MITASTQSLICIVNFKKATVTGAPQFTREQCETAVRIAHDAGKPVAAHCSGDAGVRVAVEAGVDFIEHGYFMSRETMDLLIERELAWTPTLIPVHAQWNHGKCCGWNVETRLRMEDILGRLSQEERAQLHLSLNSLLAATDAHNRERNHGPSTAAIAI